MSRCAILLVVHYLDGLTRSLTKGAEAAGVEITQYCTGCWDPATVAHQADEVPMARW